MDSLLKDAMLEEMAVSYTHLAVYKRQEQGEVLHLQIKEEWVGKEITVMPYLKQATTKTSVKTEVLDEPQVLSLIHIYKGTNNLIINFLNNYCYECFETNRKNSFYCRVGICLLYTSIP